MYAWYVVAVLLLAQAFSFLDRMIMGLLVGPIRETFAISDTQYSLLAGLAFAVFYALMGIPLARIADRGSRRLLIGVGIAVWSAMTAVCGLARNFVELFIARIGVGVGEASLGPAAYSMITDYFPRHQLARALSAYMVGVTVGSGLAYMIGGMVIEIVSAMGEIRLPIVGVVHGWQVTFFLVGVPGLLVALLMVTVKEPIRRGRLTVTPQPAMPVSRVMRYMWDRKRAYGAHFVGISIYIMAVYGLNLWGPTYLIRVHGYAPAAAGWTFGLIMMGAGTAGLLLAGVVADAWMKRGRHDAYIRIILISMIAMLPFIGGLAFASSSVVALPLLAIAIFFSAFQGGLSAGSLQVMTPNEMRGQATAVFLLTANLVGLGLGPTVVAAMTDYVFADDAAIGKSLALTGLIVCPLGAAILVSGLKAINRELEAARSWAS